VAEIEFRSVSKAFGPKSVLSDLSFTIESGECFTILGPSGCGKTVVLRLIAGFESPDTGSIRIGDRIVADTSAGKSIPPEDRNIGVVFQDYAVWPHKTVLDNVLYPLQMRNVPKHEAEERARFAVDQVNLTGLAERYPYQLSGGQQQRVALARALVSNPLVMLLDEPLSNLDANLREEMRFEIKELQRKTKMTILYVTHDQEVGLAISDRMAIMDSKGSFRQIGDPEEIYERPVDPFVFRFMGVSNFIPAVIEGASTRIDGSDESFIPPPAGFLSERNGKALAACRPMDIVLDRSKGAVAGKVVRKAVLGGIIDYRIEVGNRIIRAQIQTEEAVAKDLVFDEGEVCRLDFHDVVWYENVGNGEEVPA